METANELIVALVTASNQVENLDHADVTTMIDLAVALIGQLRTVQGVMVERNKDAVLHLLTVSEGAARISREEWQHGLRHAAEILRELQPTVGPHPGLPSHRPTGGDGGNY